MGYVPPAAYTTRTTSTNLDVTVNNIIYKDTVLDLKELGENIKLSHLYVEHKDVESCVNMILQANPDVKFNVIQYSRKDGKVYFYTDKKLDLSKWNDRNKEVLDVEVDNDKILKILNKTLTEDEVPENSISFSKLINIYERKVMRLERLTKKYEQLLRELLNVYSDDISLYCNPYFKSVSLNVWEGMMCTEYTFKIMGDDIRLSEIDGKNKINDILFLVGKELKEFYKICAEEKQQMLILYLDPYVISIDPGLKSSSVAIFNDDDFRMSMNFGSEWNLKCNSLKVQEEVGNKMEKLLSKIYIHLNMCPSFVKEEIEKEEKQRQEKIRLEKEALELEKQRLLEIENEKRRKQEKRESFIKKIFPFYKRKKNNK